MTLGLQIDTGHAVDYGSHDALTDALARCRTPGEVYSIEDRLHRSVMHRCYTLTNDPRHIPPGPIPRFFVRAKALCAARLTELAAEAVQARGGATADFWKWE